MAEWKLNLCLFHGKLLDVPTIVSYANGQKYAFMSLRTFVDELGKNGQWTTSAIMVPLVVLDQSKVAIVERYVKKGKELLITGYYKAWDDNQGVNQHGIVVTKMDFGPKKSHDRAEDVMNRPPIQD